MVARKQSRRKGTTASTTGSNKCPPDSVADGVAEDSSSPTVAAKKIASYHIASPTTKKASKAHTPLDVIKGLAPTPSLKRARSCDDRLSLSADVSRLNDQDNTNDAAPTGEGVLESPTTRRCYGIHGQPQPSSRPLH